MADLFELTFVGDWRVTVQSRDAAWDQRVVATNVASGTQILGGVPGMSMDVFGSRETPWTLRIEHNPGSGWSPSWVRGASAVAGLHYEFLVASEDKTDDTSDRDFNDLVIGLQKLGLAAQPVPPFAVLPETMQAMPEGVFEATLGRYFMAVRVTNIWTLSWPADARVGLTDRCRSWLAAGGVIVIDDWAPEDEAALGQHVIGGRVVVGALPAWGSKLIYFKVDVSAATTRKHQVEIQVFEDGVGAEDIALINPKAKAPISVSRTTYDSTRAAFVSQCDAGVLTASIKELTIDFASFKRAIANARKLLRGTTHTGPSLLPGGTSGIYRTGCRDPYFLDRIRRELRRFLDGADVDLCSIYRELACYCACGCDSRPRRPGGDGPWTGGKDPGLAFFAWPTVVEYTIEYNTPFAGQYGPIPFQDPWWKLLLILLAILLSLAAGASSVTDLANRSDDVVIGTVTRSILNALSASPTPQPVSTDPGTIDAAVVTLNGNRSLTSAIFSLLDAEDGEFYTASPIVALNGQIDLPGTTLSNADIDTLFQNLHDHPTDPAVSAALRVYKSGARSGIGRGLLVSSLTPVYPRVHDGVASYLLNQITVCQDLVDTSDALSCSGDSGSLWIQESTNAIVGLNHSGPTDESGSGAGACRIQDVMDQLGIRFA
jgi:hypothetical protein